jgi:hypothetical protein
MTGIAQAERDACHDRRFLQEVAVAVLDARARLDCYSPGEYDPVEDPDGFVVSVLNALHQHCERYNVDWESELRHAQHLFEEDTRRFRKWFPNG